jgi:hypothetical protein
LPVGPGWEYDPADVDGAVVEAVREIRDLRDVTAFADRIEQPIRIGFQTFLGGTSTIVIDQPGDRDEKLRIEVTKHAGIVYLQIVETENGNHRSDLRFEVRAKDGTLAAAWLRQVGPMTFAGYPDADTGTVNLILSVIQADGQILENELRLDSLTGNISKAPVPEERSSNESFAPMFSEQLNDGSHGGNLGALERALGFR